MLIDNCSNDALLWSFHGRNVLTPPASESVFWKSSSSNFHDVCREARRCMTCDKFSIPSDSRLTALTLIWLGLLLPLPLLAEVVISECLFPMNGGYGGSRIWPWPDAIPPKNTSGVFLVLPVLLLLMLLLSSAVLSRVCQEAADGGPGDASVMEIRGGVCWHHKIVSLNKTGMFATFTPVNEQRLPRWRQKRTKQLAAHRMKIGVVYR